MLHILKLKNTVKSLLSLMIILAKINFMHFYIATICLGEKTNDKYTL